MLENPGDALRAMADWDDLKSGDQGRWLGHVLPALMLGSVTDGVGLFVRTARLLHRFAQEQEAIQRLAREVGDEAQRLTDQLGRSTTAALLTAKMPASEIRQFVDGFGAARVHELVQKYTAKSLAYYGYEFFKEFRGVTDDTMNHVIKFVRMEKGKIVGCHDRNAFLAALRGNGEIERVVMDSKDANIERIEYRLYKRARDQSVVQPPTLRDGKVRSKTVITNLDPQLWRRRAEEATDRAIREGRLPRDGDEFREFADDGTELTLYFRPPLIDSFFPVLK
jgi:hypothetical protein